MAWRFLRAVRASLVRLGRMNERMDFRRHGVAVSPCGPPGVDHAVVEVYVIPGKRAQFARSQPSVMASIKAL